MLFVGIEYFLQSSIRSRTLKLKINSLNTQNRDQENGHWTWTQYQNITLRKGRTIAIIHVAFLHFLLLQELLIFFLSIMSPAHYFSIFTIANLGQFYTDMANNAVLL